MIANTDTISFPGEAKGLDALDNILVRRFADEFENIYTFALSRPTAAHRRHFPCHWLVAMSVKDDGKGIEKLERSKKTFGWMLVETLVQQYNGSFNIESQSGTQVQITLAIDQ